MLTINGETAGVQGSILLDDPVESADNVSLTLCRNPGEWEMPFDSIPGYYVALLDGESDPFHLLPLTAQANVPRLRDLGDAWEACVPSS